MFTWHGLERLLIAGAIAIAALPMRAFAQDAVVTGSVTDTTGGVLPGVTVVALHEATGNKFLAVTDTRGHVPASCPHRRFQGDGGAHGIRPDHHDGRIARGAGGGRRSEAGARDAAGVGDGDRATRRSSIARARRVGSNVDPRQMQELPLNGRNFVDLTMLAPGSRQNASTDELGAASGTFQLNVDGLRVTQNQTAGFGQPKYSRDAIAEFEFVANRFDATQGGSSGTLVNADHEVRHQRVRRDVLRLLPRRPVHREGLRAEPRPARTRTRS